MINLNVMKIAMFVPVKDKKSSLSNSTPYNRTSSAFTKKAKLLLRMSSRQSIFKLLAYPL